MRRSAIAVVAAIVVGGCGGGEQQEQEQVFTAADATRIANLRPVTPGWTAWPKSPDKPVSATESDNTEPLVVELKKLTADLVDIGDAGNKWRDDVKLANLTAIVFGSASDAHEMMAPFNAFSRGWAKKGGRITKDEEIDGLGDEAWLFWLENYGYQVTYHWRRGNLVVEAHVHCFRLCPDDVDAAARAWVDAIDEAARTGS